MAKYRFRCTYCGAGFVDESKYMKHECKAMQRDKEIRTPTGQAAYNYYSQWMVYQQKKPPKVQTFLSSRYYTSFIKFARFVKSAAVPNPSQFIRFMIKRDMDPHIWHNDAIYSEYIEYLDKGSDPFQQADYTVNYLFKIADELGCDIGEVFNQLEPIEVIDMIRKRLLSPWILLHSSKFQTFVKNKFNTEQQQLFRVIVSPVTWKRRRAENPEVVEKMKKIVKELNL